MAVDAPQSEKTPEFLRIRRLLEAAQVRVPAMLAADVEAGFMLLEDLGDDTLLPALGERSVNAWYATALGALGRLATIPTDIEGLQWYDAVRLQAELDLFKDWFVPRLLALEWSPILAGSFVALSRCLISSASEQPKVVVHRDFHSRNLMVVQNSELAVIDFQDAVIGPVTYDPVSLLKDCYIQWPRQRQIAWLLDYKRALTEQLILKPVTDDTFIRWFDLMGLQRHLKVLGIFTRLSLRDGKSGYLDDLSLVLAYVLETLALYASSESAIADFRGAFLKEVLPACVSQSWYREVATI